MKKITCIAVLCHVLNTIAIAQNTSGIVFEHSSLDSALLKAKNEGKLLFIDAYTDWCKPCKWMAENVFTNDTVGQFFNDHFVSVKIDMDIKKIEGKKLAELYQINCYPTYLFIANDGSTVYRFSGGLKVTDFVTASQKALDPSNNFAMLKNLFESKTISASDFLNYLNIREESCLSVSEELTSYFETQKDDELLSRGNWNILQRFTPPADSRIFTYLVEHRDLFDAGYGTDSVGKIITTVYKRNMSRYLPYGKNQDTVSYYALRQHIVDLQFPESKELVLTGDLWLYYNTGNWDAYAKNAIPYVQNYVSKNDFGTLNNMAWNFYEHVDDQNYLDIATTWVQQSLQLRVGYFNVDTYAGLLYKRGKYEEALTQVDRAIDLAEKEGIKDYDATIKLKKKIEVALGIQ